MYLYLLLPHRWRGRSRQSKPGRHSNWKCDVEQIAILIHEAADTMNRYLSNWKKTRVIRA